MGTIINYFKKYDLWCIALILITRIFLIGYVYPDRGKIFNEDSLFYEGLALNYLESGEYTYPQGGEFSDMVRPPGFPIFIMINYLIFGKGNFISLLFWNLIGTFFVYAGIKKLFRILRLNEQPLIFLFFSVDLTWLLYSKEVITEPIFTPLFVWGVNALLTWFTRKKYFLLVLSSGLFGLCSLIKPIVLYLPLMLAIFLGAHERKTKPIFVFLFVYFIIISPWLIRNKIVHDTFSFTKTQNSNLLYGHAAFIYSDLYQLTHREAQQRLETELEKSLHADQLDSPEYHELNEAHFKLSKNIFKKHPILFTKAIVRGMVITLFDPGRIVFNRTFPFEEVGPIGLTNTVAKEGIYETFKLLLQKDKRMAIGLISYLIFLSCINFLSMVGCFAMWKENKFSFLLLTSIVMYLLVIGGPIGNSRFRMYIFPFLLLYANQGLTHLRNYFKHTKV